MRVCLIMLEFEFWWKILAQGYGLLVGVAMADIMTAATVDPMQ